MYLNKLEIIGFKSFADKVAIDFDSGVTAIVGPNGCGKTNIVDAVRWVIGEQKASVLRSSTMENVIFNGTKERKALGYAQVSLTIENTKGILPSEYSEITITRRCFRDGQSNYLINGAMCRLKDITALFMDTGMGADAYSVIELKMVNDILSHRTQDRRKLFEEAAGITKYKERRREALYKLEVAKESLTEANIEIRNRQRTVNAYERIAQKQEEAKQISDNLKLIEIEYHQRSLSRLIDETRQVESLLKEKEKEREVIQVKLNENDSIIVNYRKELNDIEIVLNETRDRLGDLYSQINEIQTSISISEQRISFLRENIERFSGEKIELEQQIEKLKQGRTEFGEKIAVLEETLKLSEHSKQEKITALAELESMLKTNKEELKDLSAKHASVSKTLLEKRNEYEIIKNKLEDQLARGSKLTEQNITNLNRSSQYDKDIGILENDHSDKKQLLEKLSVEYTELKQTKDNYAAGISSLEKEIVNKSYETEKLRDKIQFQINLLENYEDYSEGVKYLVKERKEKDVNVIIDRLEVEDKFKIAIETALGEISNYLIVNNIDTAQKFIDTLTEAQKGKITFILKDNLYKNTFNIFQDEFSDILNKEGVYGWADKFIKCPDDYFLLYKYLLDEYIIVENLDVARKLSKDNFIKFITLDGDIVTDSFLRAGSKTNVETLKIGREKLIAELKTKIEEFDRSIEQDRSSLKNLKTSHTEIDVDSCDRKIQELRGTILETENKIAQITYLKAQTNTVIENYNVENSKLSESTKGLSSKMDKLIQEIEEAENTKYQREKELDHFTGELEHFADDLTAKREDYNSFNIEITKLKGELINYRNEITRTDKNIEAVLNTIKTRIEECEQFEDEIKILKAEIETIDESGSISGLKQKLQEIEARKADVETDYNLVKREYEIKKNLVDRLDQEQRLMRDKRDEIIDFIHRNEMKLTKDRLEMKEHKDRVWEEYNMEIVYSEYSDNDMYDFVKTKTEIDKYRYRLKQLGGTGQMELGIYEQEKRELEKLLEEKEDLVKAEEDLINLIDQINKTAQEKFTETFEFIRKNFQGIFRELFMEGDEADLKLVADPENPDPLDAKIDIIAKPRGKRPQLIDLLSGGEKTLTAIALLFAIYQVKPSPFCILDEVDAPLDDANIDRFIKIIRKFSKDTQFIIVTHNKRTMEASDSMYGVTMAEEGISTIVNVQFNDSYTPIDN
ncbi:MAG: chromosome segregation protein SMC [Ignavibacteria bacterium]